MTELIPKSYIAPLDLPKIFGRIAALQVDLGCGDGSFLEALAVRCPETNFLGVERMAGRIDKACRKTSQLENIRFLHLESAYVVERLLPPDSVQAFHLLFPDPWPKRRHRERRLVTLGFLKSIHRALEKHGVLRIVTDEANYFDQIQQLIRKSREFGEINANENFPISTFEARFQKSGIPIYRLVLQKVSPVT